MKWAAILERAKGTENQYSLSVIGMDDGDKVNFMTSVRNGEEWFEYRTPFGDTRFVNLKNFDTIDVKPWNTKE